MDNRPYESILLELPIDAALYPPFLRLAGNVCVRHITGPFRIPANHIMVTYAPVDLETGVFEVHGLAPLSCNDRFLCQLSPESLAQARDLP